MDATAAEVWTWIGACVAGAIVLVVFLYYFRCVCGHSDVCCLHLKRLAQLHNRFRWFYAKRISTKNVFSLDQSVYNVMHAHVRCIANGLNYVKTKLVRQVPAVMYLRVLRVDFFGGRCTDGDLLTIVVRSTFFSSSLITRSDLLLCVMFNCVKV